MTFWDHLDELRKALAWPLVVLVTLTIVTFMFKESVFDAVLAANDKEFITYRLTSEADINTGNSKLIHLISTELPAQLLMHMKVSFYVAIVLSIPFLLYKLYRFALPALHENERRYSARVVLFTFVAFFTGILINYFIIFPFSLRFLATYQVNSQVDIMITLDSYIGTLLSLSILMGICFELPVMSWLLSKLGLLNAEFLRKYRKYAIVGIFILSAIITPTTDIFTLLLVSVPILLLYELSIVITKASQQKDENISEV